MTYQDMPSTAEEFQEFAMRERRSSVSEREWNHRLRGYGYAVKRSEAGAILMELSRGTRLCSLPV